MALGNIEQWIYGFLTLGIFGAIAAVILTSIQSAVTQCAADNSTFNASQGLCVNASNSSILTGSFTAQYNVSGDGTSAILNLTNQFGTAGTLVGLGIVALAAIVIVGYFGFGKNRAN